VRVWGSPLRASGSATLVAIAINAGYRQTFETTNEFATDQVVTNHSWMVAAFLDAETSFRRILGYRDLWMLKAILNENQVANRDKAA
jgi:hypothetical protein